MFSRIFIDRPIFAWVIAIVIMMAGLGAILSLPIEQYPDVAPPQVNVSATYTGASADILETSVTQVIEQQLTGLDGLIYFTSTSSSAGTVTINVVFNKGTNPDIAQVQVQNKVQEALPRLPQEVQQQGLVVTKSNNDFLLVAGIFDSSGRSTNRDIADYLVTNLQDAIGRLPGVGNTQVFGTQYAMRIWLDPYRLQAYSLMPSDVITAIEAQNTQVAAGEIGAQPSPNGQELDATVTSRSRLTTPAQFENIIVKTQTDGSKVLLSNVGRVELGSENYQFISRWNRDPATGIAVQLAPSADALKTAEIVKKYMSDQAPKMPYGYHVVYPRDSTTFIKLSVEEVVKTLVEAIVLVVIVMFVFLQSWRATLIPAIAVPVVLLGTFGILAMFGFSINTLTLFGLVLAIGLLVDDAIVVVENVERVMDEEPDLSPREATIKSMGEIQIALVAIALVLSTVFLPMAFFGGSTGVIYRQFSVTIVSSMALSVLVALILTPALTATLLKRPQTEEEEKDAPKGWLGRHWARFTDWFNERFDRGVDRYRDGVKFVIGRRVIFLVGYAALVVVLGLLFLRLPTSFLPNEDQGSGIIQYTLPPGATLSRTLEAAKEIENYFLGPEKKDIDGIFTINGFRFGGQGQNVGQGFLEFSPWDDRKGKKNSADAITQRATMKLSSLRDVQFYALTPPPITGLGQSNGFTMEFENATQMSRQEFERKEQALLAAANADHKLAAVRLTTLEDVPTLHVDVDQEKAGALGLSQADIDNTLSAAWGGIYVNDFVDRGRVKRVFIQGDAPYRARPEDLQNWYVRGSSGTMAPFSAFAHINWNKQPTTLMRFNGRPTYEFQGQGGPGVSSGQAMEEIAALAAKQPGTSVEWSSLSYQERISSGQAPKLYGISLLVIFLCLAALYESWSIPLSVLLVIPLGLIGAVIAVTLRGLDNDIYFQVGLLTTMGLSAKNAILIVEFAEQGEARGQAPVEAVLEAARLRLRPILMTSLAFVFGVLPLAISTGAGANSRVAIGTAVIGGMLTATILAIFYVPLFFVVVRSFFKRKPRPGEDGYEDQGKPTNPDNRDHLRDRERRQGRDPHSGEPVPAGA